jgi:hypothetical protein
MTIALWLVNLPSFSLLVIDKLNFWGLKFGGATEAAIDLISGTSGAEAIESEASIETNES